LLRPFAFCICSFMDDWPKQTPSPSDAVPDRARRGRGAVSNRSGRYEPESRALVDDGWGSADEELPPLKTSVSIDTARHVITRNNSPDIGFDRSINPYRGCEHGCVYCFARPTHAYLGLSPGLDFESRLFAKPDAAACLRAELAKPGYRPRPIAFGTNTDPYQPLERRLKITRQLFEVLAETKHPITITTKSDLVLRDLDILVPMARDNLVSVALSVTTLDPKLARVMEPRAAAPRRRMAAIEQLAKAGVPASIMTAPLIPAINDHELEGLLEAAAKVGARGAGYVLLRLPLEIKELFEEWLDQHFPDRKKRVLDLIRQMRGGKLYDSRWGTRQTGEGPVADLLRKRFKRAARQFGLDTPRPPLDVMKFRAPPADSRQMTLL
jgi:DNA repair photolyase